MIEEQLDLLTITCSFNHIFNHFVLFNSKLPKQGKHTQTSRKKQSVHREYLLGK